MYGLSVTKTLLLNAHFPKIHLFVIPRGKTLMEFPKWKNAQICNIPFSFPINLEKNILIIFIIHLISLDWRIVDYDYTFSIKTNPCVRKIHNSVNYHMMFDVIFVPLLYK